VYSNPDKSKISRYTSHSHHLVLPFLHLLPLLLLCTATILPMVAIASTSETTYGTRGTTEATQNLKTTLENIKNLLLGFVGIVAAIALIFVGLKYMKPTSSAEERSDARTHLQNVLTGLLLCLMAGTLVAVLTECVVT